jgi:hypothetical protein
MRIVEQLTRVDADTQEAGMRDGRCRGAPNGGEYHGG